MSENVAPAVDTLFDLFADRRRRYVLYQLADDDEPIELSALARQAAAWELDVPVERVGDDSYRQIYAELHHVHVPRLAEGGLVEYDEAADAVRLTNRDGVLTEWLTVSERDDLER